MKTITVFWGAKHFNYKSLISPLVGDVIPKVKQWDDKHFTVVERILITDNDNPELLCITVEETLKLINP